VPLFNEVMREIAGMPVAELKDRWQVTASIGASELRSNDTEIAEVLARADAALYRAKEAGRNQIALDRAA
jgi:diguanylate cyclase (GGDEF)-like protein